MEKGTANSEPRFHRIWYVTLACFVLSIPLLTVVTGFWEDPYIYLELAESIQHGRYESHGIIHYKYMPGFPACIAFFHVLFLHLMPLDLAGKLVSLVSRCMTLPVVFFIARQLGLPKLSAWFAVFVHLLNPWAMEMSVMVFSESLFAFLVSLALLCMYRKNDVAAGLVSAGAVWVRTEAVFLILCRMSSRWSFSGLIRYGGACILFILPLALRQADFWFQESGGYLSEALLPKHAGIGFLLEFPKVLGWFVIFFVVYGVMDRKLRNQWTLHLFPLCFTILHLWWWWTEDRFILSMLPVLAVYAGHGLGMAHKRLSKTRYWGLLIRPFWTAVLIFIFGGRFLVMGSALLLEERTRSELFISVVEKMESPRFKPGAIISSDPGLVRYHSSRGQVATWDDQHIHSYIFLYKSYQDKNARYIVLPGYYIFDHRFSPLLKQDIQYFDFMVHSSSSTNTPPKLYRMIVDRVAEKSGDRIRFREGFFWWKPHGVIEHEHISVQVFEMTMDRIPATDGTIVNAIPVSPADLE